MARVALVSGERGASGCDQQALKAAGYKVAANYAGNDAAADKFKNETGIPIYKWDVSSFEACARAQAVETDLGRSRCSSTMRHHPRRRVSQDDAGAVERGHQHNLGSLFN